MSEPLSWSLILSAAKAGHSIIDDSKRSELIKKFNLMWRSNRKIVVFGISGAGKSQFINSLRKSLFIPERTLLTNKVKFEVEDFPLVFFDTPGHEERKFERKKETLNILKNGVEGIINVVSYGYEENPESELEKIFSVNGDVKESFLNQNRSLEIARLSEWLNDIQPADTKWIINLVNKADLWWDSFDEVNKHYEKGEYFNSFKSIDNYLSLTSLPYCSIIKPYFDRTTSGRFGDIQKEIMQQKLIHTLTVLLKDSK
jgi:hypothetical protein